MKTISIDKLIHSEYNPRKMTDDQHKALKDSVDRFGLVDPIIVNSNKDRENIVIGGHQRLKIAKELNIEEVPVVCIDLDRDRERELNIRLNQNLGEWDWEILEEDFEINELVEWGFDESELAFEVDVYGFDGKDEAGGRQTNNFQAIKGDKEGDVPCKIGEMYFLIARNIYNRLKIYLDKTNNRALVFEEIVKRILDD